MLQVQDLFQLLFTGVYVFLFVETSEVYIYIYTYMHKYIDISGQIDYFFPNNTIVIYSNIIWFRWNNMYFHFHWHFQFHLLKTSLGWGIFGNIISAKALQKGS